MRFFIFVFTLSSALCYLLIIRITEKVLPFKYITLFAVNRMATTYISVYAALVNLGKIEYEMCLISKRYGKFVA